MTNRSSQIRAGEKSGAFLLACRSFLLYMQPPTSALVVAGSTTTSRVIVYQRGTKGPIPHSIAPWSKLPSEDGIAFDSSSVVTVRNSVLWGQRPCSARVIDIFFLIQLFLRGMMSWCGNTPWRCH